MVSAAINVERRTQLQFVCRKLKCPTICERNIAAFSATVLIAQIGHGAVLQEDVCVLQITS